jgi:voltage-gated potassium channel
MKSSLSTQLDSTLAKLDGVHSSTLSPSTMRQMQTHIQQRLEYLNQEATDCLNEAQESLAKADPNVLRFAKTKARLYRQEAENLGELHASLEDRIQREIIRTNMVRQLGSARRLAVAEALIFLLIMIVLGLLVYDIACGPDTVRPAVLSSENIFKIDLVCCVIFMAEFIWRLSCAESKTYVWKHHWVDFLTSIPVPGEAQLARFGRLARLARFARLLRLLRFARLFFIVWRGMDKLQDVMDVEVMKKTIRWAVVATCVGAIAIYKLEGTIAEGPAGAGSVNSVGTLLRAGWWSFTTVLTGGFGDIHNPESLGGQFVTGVLVITGMVLVGVFTATLTSLFIGNETDELERLNDDVQRKLERIEKRLDLLGSGNG